MSSYETRIGQVHNSVFAIGDQASARGRLDRIDRDEGSRAVQVLLGILSKYSDPVALDAASLARAASREITAEKPDKSLFQRLADATRAVLENLGPGIAEVGALADAVSKVSDLVRHL
jgi:hypothetical protein